MIHSTLFSSSILNRDWPHLRLLLRLIAFCCLGMTAVAQPPDLTAGGAPTSTKNLNLGPTGLHGWLYHVTDDSSESRQILIYSVDAGSPADGTLAVDDVILGADGTGAAAAPFSWDARKALAQAIADAEASSPATLSLLRWRAGVTTTETITLQTMGSYSATAPYNCPKSSLILDQGIDYVMANQDAGVFSMGTLALLAVNNPADPDNVARLARAQSEALAIMPTQVEIDAMLAGEVSTESKISWQLGHKLTVLCEYYLLTGDTQVLPGIEAFALMAANGQSHLGTMGHQLTSPGPDGSFNVAYNVGYGVVNSAGMPCFLGLLLAKKCGLTNPEIDPAIVRASRFFASYAGYGAHPYGEHEPYRASHESNGKSGLAAICFSLQSNRVDEGKFYAQMATAAANERANGHTGPWFNYLWAPLGAAIGGEVAAAEHFSRISWRLDLSRRWDGGFEFNNLSNEGGDGGTLGWRDTFYMYTPALLTYALPLRQLAITGKSPDPARWLTGTEVAEATFADDYVAVPRTTSELVTDLGNWSPKVQKLAAEEIGNRTAEHATLVPQLITIANDTNAGGQRVGACLALGEIGDGSAAADLAGLLDDPDDEVRYASAEGLRYLPQADKLAQINTIMAAAASTGKPFLPIDEEDPLQFAHHRMAMLLFYGGNAYGPKGVIWGSNLTGIDRNLLYPAIRAVAQNPNGQARSCVGETYRNLTQADVEAVSGAIVDSVYHRAPADKMFSGGVRQGGLDALQSYNYSEGVPLARIVVEEDGQQDSIKTHALGVLEQYAGSSVLVTPDPGIDEFCEYLVFTNPTLAADAQLVLDAIAADASPTTPTAFKSIQSVAADDSSLTLPVKSTQLHVSAVDLADGDSIYTWRKVHGAGGVSFFPNGTSDAVDTTIVFEGIPGQYLFEVTMSDSRGLTEVYDTVQVTLLDTGGSLPSNDPPTANAQLVTLTQATTTPITLTGSDPEGYALNYAVTGLPVNGKLSGIAPYLTYISDFNFTGSDSFSFEVTDSEGQTSSATVSITVDPASGLETAIYEPFDYPAGLLNGQSGSTEVGLDGVWAGQTSSAFVSAGSLTYGSLFTAGGKFEPTGASNNWGGTRTISSTALADNGLLNDGATLWFSAVVGYGPLANGTNCRLAVALANNGFNSGNYNYWIDNDGALLGSGVGFVMGRHDVGNGTVKAAQFQDLSQGDGYVGNIYGSWEGNGASYTVGEHGLIVGRITWSADPLEPDIIEIFQPNTDMELPTAPISVLSVTVDQSTFDTLTFSRGDYALLDEIRFGPNYHSVLLGTVSLSEDLTAPTPDPVGFAVVPTVLNGTSVTMTAATAHDSSGVEYSFTCTAGGGNDSGWQGSATYTDTGLTPGVQYSYTVTARDLSPAQNTTTTSAAESVTLPTSLNVPDVVGMVQATAGAVIVNSGFTVGTVTLVSSDTIPAGEVISQTPVGDASAAVGSNVDLVVSSGPDITPPDLVGTDIVDDQSGGPLVTGTLVTYTVTFSEDMDDATVGALDFANAGSSAITIGAITETSPGVFTVEVTPTDSGTLQLSVAAGAVLEDVAGNPLDTASAILDDTTLTVELPLAILSITPSTAESGSVVNVDIDGSNLTADCTVQLVRGGYPAIVGTSVQLNGGTLNCNLDLAGAPPGPWDVVVTKGEFNSADLVDGFSIVGVLWQENFDGSLSGWSSIQQTGNNNWALTTTQYHSPSTSYFAPGPASRTTTRLESPSIDVPVDGSNLQFRFWHNYDLENLIDGGRLEISSDNGASWVGVEDVGSGASYTSNGPTVNLSGSGNPANRNELDGLPAWTGSSGGSFIETVVDLDAATYAGSTMRVRWILGTDSATSSPGWYVDSATLTGSGTIADTTLPTLASTDIVDDQSGGPVTVGDPVTYTVTFSEDIDADTVEASDFANAGTSVVAIGTISEISPGVFTIEVTPTTLGSLQLQVKALASISDPSGNALDTAIAIVDDTTIDVISAYGGWAAVHPEFIDTTPANDFDGSGLSNGMEWALGGDPMNAADDRSIMPTIDNSDPDYLRFSYQRDDVAAADSDTVISVVYGTDLVTWQDAVHDGTNIIINVTDDGAGAGLDRVEVKISRSLGEGNKVFARLKVVINNP